MSPIITSDYDHVKAALAAYPADRSIQELADVLGWVQPPGKSDGSDDRSDRVLRNFRESFTVIMERMFLGKKGVGIVQSWMYLARERKHVEQALGLLFPPLITCLEHVSRPDVDAADLDLPPDLAKLWKPHKEPNTFLSAKNLIGPYQYYCVCFFAFANTFANRTVKKTNKRSGTWGPGGSGWLKYLFAKDDTIQKGSWSPAKHAFYWDRLRDQIATAYTHLQEGQDEGGRAAGGWNQMNVWRGCRMSMAATFLSTLGDTWLAEEEEPSPTAAHPQAQSNTTVVDLRWKQKRYLAHLLIILSMEAAKDGKKLYSERWNWRPPHMAQGQLTQRQKLRRETACRMFRFLHTSFRMMHENDRIDHFEHLKELTSSWCTFVSQAFQYAEEKEYLWNDFVTCHYEFFADLLIAFVRLAFKIQLLQHPSGPELVCGVIQTFCNPDLLGFIKDLSDQLASHYSARSIRGTSSNSGYAEVRGGVLAQLRQHQYMMRPKAPKEALGHMVFYSEANKLHASELIKAAVRESRKLESMGNLVKGEALKQVSEGLAKIFDVSSHSSMGTPSARTSPTASKAQGGVSLSREGGFLTESGMQESISHPAALLFQTTRLIANNSDIRPVSSLEIKCLVKFSKALRLKTAEYLGPISFEPRRLANYPALATFFIIYAFTCYLWAVWPARVLTFVCSAIFTTWRSEYGLGPGLDAFRKPSTKFSSPSF